MKDKTFYESVRNKIHPYFYELYNEFHKTGLLSFYLWGSAARKDYKPGKSDIDVIGIVNSSFTEEKRKQLRNRRYYKRSNIALLKIRCIYLNDLTEDDARSELSKYINPKLLVLDFPNWEYLIGRKFYQEQFKTCTLEEGIGLRIKALFRRLDKIKSDRKNKNYEYLVKEAFQLCFLINKIESGTHCFSYAIESQYSTDYIKYIVNNLKNLRQNSYPPKLYDHSVELLNDFAIYCKNYVRNKYLIKQ